MQKRVQDMTMEEKAEAFVDRVVLDKDDPQCSIEQELLIIEGSHLFISWDIGPVMLNVFYLLKRRNFDFKSFRGQELLQSLKKRYLSPEKYGYTRTSFSPIPMIVRLATDREILEVY